MRVKRIDQEEQYIQEHHSVSMEQLCTKFSVSMNTARRDMDTLIKKGTVTKVYGGVTAVEPTTTGELLSFNVRHIKHREAKEAIAKKAAAYVEEGDTIYLDTGTSTLYVVDYLKHLDQVTVITNSVQVMYKALPYPNIKLIGLPGTLKRDTASLVGNACLSQLRDYNITRCFMACTALTLDVGVCNSAVEEKDIKQLAMERSQQHILLVDSSKFDKTSMMTFCQVGDLDKIITEKMPPENYVRFCEENGIDLEIC